MSDGVQRALFARPASVGEATVRGTIDGVVFQSPDQRFGVVRVRTLDGLDAVVVGDVGNFAVGEQIRASGRWEDHATYGRRLRAVAVVPELPSTIKGIEKLLGSGFVDGIGSDLARRVVAQFGSATLDVIADHPERLREVGGIGPTRARRIQEAFRSRRAESEIRSFLQAGGVGPALTQRILKQFGAATATVVHENPYRLALEVSGVGFRTSDRIGRELGISTDDPRRAQGVVIHLLDEAGDDGHTALPREELLTAATALEVPRGRVEDALGDLAARERVVIDGALVYPPPLFRAEELVARRMRAIANAKAEPMPARAWGVPLLTRALESLHANQQRAVRSLAESNAMVITGGPGTGKTTTVRAIVALCDVANLRLELCAPTGRAAKRLSEATGRPARTIHRVLEWSPRLGRFMRDHESPLRTDVLLVDEASMLDVVLAARLLDAIADGTRVVFVGDVDQLPSVGPGTVLADFLATAWIPSVRLTEVFRQAAESAIVRAAHDILHGRTPTSSPARTGARSGVAPAGEFFLVASRDASAAAKTVVDIVSKRVPESFGLDPLRDLQVLVPMHKGALGLRALNQMLQLRFNPSTARDGGGEGSDRPPRIGPGDKVMQTRNDYELEVWNGDVGVVRAMDRESTTVEIDGRAIVFRGDSREALTLAYAATVHKAQGSEYDAVVIALDTSHYMLLTRQLLYTAVTRARRLAIVVGNPEAMKLAIRNARAALRHGALQRRLAATA